MDTLVSIALYAAVAVACFVIAIGLIRHRPRRTPAFPEVWCTLSWRHVGGIACPDQRFGQSQCPGHHCKLGLALHHPHVVPPPGAVRVEPWSCVVHVSSEDLDHLTEGGIFKPNAWAAAHLGYGVFHDAFTGTLELPFASTGQKDKADEENAAEGWHRLVQVTIHDDLER